MAKQAEHAVSAPGALERLVNREEILQICYWYQGEGLGDIYNAQILQPFLNYDEVLIEIAFDELIGDGYFETVSAPTQGYCFTENGKKKAVGYLPIVLLIFKKRDMGNARQDVARMVIIPNVVTIVYCIKIQS